MTDVEIIIFHIDKRIDDLKTDIKDDLGAAWEKIERIDTAIRGNGKSKGLTALYESLSTSVASLKKKLNDHIQAHKVPRKWLAGRLTAVIERVLILIAGAAFIKFLPFFNP